MVTEPTPPHRPDPSAVSSLPSAAGPPPETPPLAEPNSPNDRPSTPPRTAAAISKPPRRPVWPTAIGIVAVVFASLGLLGNGGGVLFSFIAPLISNFMEDSPLAGQPGMEGLIAFHAMADWWIYQAASACAAFLAALWLLIGGIGLLQRRRGGPPNLLGWAVVKMVIVVLSALVMFQMQQAQMEAQLSNVANTMTPPGSTTTGPNTAAATPPGPPIRGGPPALFTNTFSYAVAAAIAVLTLLWGWAQPIFMLIWLPRKKIKAEYQSW